MKLIIRRNQKEQKGLLGGHKGVTFSLHCRVELTKEEQTLVNKYKAGQYVFTNVKNNDGQPLQVIVLMRGITYTIEDVTTLVKNEDAIKEACQELKLLLEVMDSFGGEEVIEF